MKGQLAFVLHAHLPYVRHPELSSPWEEDWFHEAVSEVYLPLVQVLRRLADERLGFRVAISVSPPLAAMLGDGLLKQRFEERLGEVRRRAELEAVRQHADPRLARVARFYAERLGELQALYRGLSGDVLGALRALAEEGFVELFTTAATHAFLPLLQASPSSVRAQVRLAMSSHQAHFGRRPQGFWLPECGYYPGLEQVLADEGVRYFIVDAKALIEAMPRPVFGTYAPVLTPVGVAAFGRDPQASEQVWSAELGYPGDPDYREFYRDLPWDPREPARGTGLKSYRITGATERKEPYEPEVAARRAAEHGRHFVESRVRQLSEVSEALGGRAPLVVAPYDAELFGHWWYEGPHFLEAVVRAAQGQLELVSPSQYLDAHGEHQLVDLPLSSWGEQGGCQTWLNPSNDWIHRHVLRCSRLMDGLVGRDGSEVIRRAVRQAARELLLAQSSDWAFILRSQTTVDYAERRLRRHVSAFLSLQQQIDQGQVDSRQLEELEAADNLFPRLDVSAYR